MSRPILSCMCIPLLVALSACGDPGETGEADPSTSTNPSTPTTGEQISSEGTGAASEAGTSADETTTAADSSSGATTDPDTGSSGGDPPADAWLRSFGAPDTERPGGIGFTPGGELWVAGDVIGAFDLGTGPLSGEGSGIYLARLSAGGETLHAQSLYPASGEPTFTSVTGLAVDGTGAVIVTGWLEGSYEIGGEMLAADEIDVFVGKWDVDGAPRWGRKFGEVDWQVGYGVAVGPDDDVWVAGAALAPFMVGDLELTGAASTGMFLIRLASDGTPEYGRWWGEMGDQEARGVAICDDGSVALAGFITAPLMFGAEEVMAVGDKDMFVAHLDAAGEPQWIRGLGGASTDYASHVQCGGDVLFAGAVTGAATIGALELTPAGDADAVLGQFAADGTLTWAAGVTGPDDQSPGGIGFHAPNNEAFVVLTSTGMTTLGDQALPGAGDRDVVLARYALPATSPSETVLLGDASREIAGPLIVHASGYAALAASHAGALAWDGLRPVQATGTEDLAVLRWSPTPL